MSQQSNGSVALSCHNQKYFEVYLVKILTLRKQTPNKVHFYIEGKNPHIIMPNKNQSTLQ